MKLVFVRHATAMERSDWKGKDADRPLVPEGRKETKRVARGLAQREVVPDRVYSSPFARARETAEIAAAVLGFAGKVRFTDALRPEAPFAEFARLAAEFGADETVFLVGHEPGLGRFVSILVSGRENVALNFKKCGTARVDVSGGGVAPGAGELRWFVPPKFYE